MNKRSGDKTTNSRRDFLKLGMGAVAAGAGALSPLRGAFVEGRGPNTPPPTDPVFRKDDVILFQGDSITDAWRFRKEEARPNFGPALGMGYVNLIASRLLAARAGTGLRIYNRGISGHKVFQLADRWQNDCLDLQPDVLSILIGVNDIWHQRAGRYPEGTVKKYRDDYDALLSRTRKARPGIRLVICEPFALHCGAVKDDWFPEFDAYRAAARELAARHEAIFIPFQSMFDRALDRAGAAEWASDGVHPTPAGAEVMARGWLGTVDPQ